MRVLRRVVAAALVVAAAAGIVVIERRTPQAREGAAFAIAAYAGFPQATSGPRISTSWFCPGVGAGDGVDAARVVIANPGDAQITASLTFLSGGSPEVQTVSVGPRSRLAVDALRGRTVGAIVPVVEIVGAVGSVEQEVVFGAGDVTSQCASQTSPTWFFADGFTAEGSTHRLVLTNPFPETAVVNVSFTTVDGRRSPTSLQGLILGPRSARSVSLAESGAQNESRIAVEVRATTGQIVAARIQHYLGGGRLGYSTSLGSADALTEWWFTAGRTGPAVTENLVIFNPGETAASVNIAFFGDGITNGIPLDQQSGAALPNSIADVPAGGVVSVNTDNLADLPKGDHAMVVSTLNGARIVVEHVLSQQTGGSWFTAVTNGLPGGLVSRIWRIPSGLSKGTRKAVSILNTTAEDGTFTVSAVGPGGDLPVTGLVDVPLGMSSVATFDVPDTVDGEVVIRATVPIAVQRRTVRGHGLIGFGIVGALPVQERR